MSEGRCKQTDEGQGNGKPSKREEPEQTMRAQVLLFFEENTPVSRKKLRKKVVYL